ncbi:MAG: hypothetical protein K2W95_15005 [Candidatus Obscuribacterales bacterium]|nr:hypothetical protein [Candidatus Obscuribacterales bacterium]
MLQKPLFIWIPIILLVIGLSIPLYKEVRDKLHLHIPIPTAKGLETKLVIIDQNALDLVMAAAEHDLHGEPDLATEDYHACIDSPSFGKFAGKIRSVLRELVDMREMATKPNYIEELLCHSEVFYWPKSRLPIKVYVPNDDSKDGFSPMDRKSIEDGLNQWIAVVPDKLSYVFVNDKAGADLVFSQRATSGDLGLSKLKAAHTVPLPERPMRWRVAPISKVNIDVVKVTPPIKNESDERLAVRKKVFLHEIGHALGLSGHSCNAADTMFFSENGNNGPLSKRDKETLKAIYTTPQLERFAETFIRARADKNDKYALMLLAMGLQANEPDSPAVRKKVFELVKRSADLGLVKAQVLVGGYYLDGDVVPRDIQKGVRYAEMAVDQDSASACLMLAHLFEKGTGTLPDVEKADYFYKRALRMDSSMAEINYADFLCYMRGDQDSYTRAATYYKMAADAFSCEAMTRLAVLYGSGYGVKKDQKEAQYWSNKALAIIDRLRPQDAAGYFLRGRLWHATNRSKEAIADFNKAIALQPKLRGAHIARGLEYFNDGDFEKAKVDLTNALQSDPQDVEPYFIRCLISLAQNKPSECLKDAKQIFEKAPDPDNTRLYGLLYSAIANRMLHDEDAAKTLIREASQRVSQSTWPAPLVRYLAGEVDASELEKLSQGEGQLTEAQAFIGLNRAAAGDSGAAKRALLWVKQNGDARFYEHAIAVATLSRIEKEGLHINR